MGKEDFDVREIPLKLKGDIEEEEEIKEVATNEFDLKKWTCEIWGNTTGEITKDFVLSNLSDGMFRNKVISYIRNRIEIMTLLRNIFSYGERNYQNKNVKIDEKTLKRIKKETFELRKIRNLLMVHVQSILILSRARGGLVLKEFLKGSRESVEKEEVQDVNFEEGEIEKRGFLSKIFKKKEKEI